MAEKFLNQHGLETYNNALQAKIAENYATKDYVNSLTGTNGLSYEIVGALPETPEASKIYLVATDEEENDIYDEYMWINDAWEKIGNTSTDLSQYATKDEVVSSIGEINTDMATLESNITSLSNWANNEFNNDVAQIINSSVGQEIDDLQVSVSALQGQLTSGSKFIYEDENGDIIITKDGYLGKFVIHADRTSLYLGNSEIAYIKEGYLYSNSIKTNSLQIGPWLYELTNSNTLNEKWIGGN